MSAMGSLERETRREQLLEREARDAADAAVGDRFEEQEPVADVGDNPFREGQDVRFEIPADHPLRAAAAARNRVATDPAATAAEGTRFLAAAAALNG